MTISLVTRQKSDITGPRESTSEENLQPASSPPQNVNSLSPALQTLRTLEQEERFSPLRLYVEVAALIMSDSSPEAKLSWIEAQIQNLYTYTMRQRAHRPSTLRRLREMQETILQQNLKRIGSFWPGKTHCCLSADRVRHWLSVEREVLFTSQDLAHNLVSLCTCLPPELARILPESVWSELSHLPPSLGESKKCFGYTLLVEKPDTIHLQDWIKERTSLPNMFLQIFLQPKYYQHITTCKTFFTHSSISSCIRDKELQPLLLRYLEQLPIEHLSQTKWNAIAETMLTLDPLCFEIYLYQCPSKQETLYAKWGMWTVGVCRQRAFSPYTLLIFCSHLERLSPIELFNAFVALSSTLSKPILELFINFFVKMPPTTFSSDQWDSLGKALFQNLAPWMEQPIITFLTNTKTTTVPHWSKWAIVSSARNSVPLSVKNLLYSELSFCSVQHSLALLQDCLLSTHTTHFNYESVCLAFFRKFVELPLIEEAAKKFLSLCSSLAIHCDPNYPRPNIPQQITNALISSLCEEKPSTTSKVDFDKLLELLYLTYPLEDSPCQYSLKTHLPILKLRLVIFEKLNRVFPPFFADYIAVHRVYLEYWEKTRSTVGDYEPSSSDEGYPPAERLDRFY